jgi:large subunit ribosomal protein L5
MAIPKIQKVVVNMGLGEATSEREDRRHRRRRDRAHHRARSRSSRAPKKSIAQFKVRQGMPIGTMVTLRG